MSLLAYPFDAAAIQRKKKALKRQLLGDGRHRIPKRIAILGGATTSELKDMLELFLLERGMAPEFYESDFNKYFEDSVFSNPRLDAFRPELSLLAVSWVNLLGWPGPADDAAAVDAQVEAEAARWAELWAAIGAKHGGQIVQNNFELPPTRLLGSLDAQDHRGRTRFVGRVNERLAQLAQLRSDTRLHDQAYVAACFGLDRWHDRQAYFLYKYACALDAVPYLAHSLASQIASLYGLSAKALATDLDNTFWGGVVGDDGLGGLQVGRETGLAEAHSAYQEYLRDLRDRGVVLAVASKNDEKNAVEGLNHPENTLKAADFSALRANWEPKDGNLLSMANELNLGVDSFVFVDDNPAERELVRVGLPQARVPELGSNVADYPVLLDRSGHFESPGLSPEDLQRAEAYAKNRERQATQSSFKDYGAFLASLEMEAELGPFQPLYLDRITQLTNKTNQFNLTTRRCEHAEIEAMAKSPNWVTLYARLRDRFGDHGLISVLAAEKQGSELWVRLWLMSCRVLKRGVEDAVADALEAAARAAGCQAIVGEYLPTEKNQMVKGHYEKLGYQKAEDLPGGGSRWRLGLSQAGPGRQAPMKVRLSQPAP